VGPDIEKTNALWKNLVGDSGPGEDGRSRVWLTTGGGVSLIEYTSNRKAVDVVGEVISAVIAVSI